MQTYKEWRTGKNIGRVLDVEHSDRENNIRLYRVRLANLFYTYLPLVYAIKLDAKQSKLIEDLLYFYRKRITIEDNKTAKPWLEIYLKESPVSGMQFVITDLKEILNPTFDEMETLSLKLRNHESIHKATA